MRETAALLEYAPSWGWGEAGKSEDKIQAPSGGPSSEVDMRAACGPGKGIWPLEKEANLTRDSGHMEGSSKEGTV